MCLAWNVWYEKQKKTKRNDLSLSVCLPSVRLSVWSRSPSIFFFFCFFVPMCYARVYVRVCVLSVCVCAISWMGWLRAVKEEFFVSQHPRRVKKSLTPLLSQLSHRPASWHKSGSYWSRSTENPNSNIYDRSFCFRSSLYRPLAFGSAFVSLYIYYLLVVVSLLLFSWEEFSFVYFLSSVSFIVYTCFFLFVCLFLLLKYLFTLSSVQLRLIVSLVNVIPKVNPGSLSAWR